MSDEGKALAAQYGVAYQPTGLEKVCPRCGRRGEVIVRGGPSDRHHAWLIAWRNPARSGGRAPDADAVSLNDLFSPTMGCGYDSIDETPPARE